MVQREISVNVGWNIIPSFTLKEASDLENIRDIYTYNTDTGYVKTDYVIQQQNKKISYWIYIVNKPLQLIITSISEDEFSLSLNKGWNLITNPFDIFVKISDFFGDNIDNIKILSYNDGSYSEVNKSDVLNPEKGYVILVSETIENIIVKRPQNLLSGTFSYKQLYTSFLIDYSFGTLFSFIKNQNQSFYHINVIKVDLPDFVTEFFVSIDIEYLWKEDNNSVFDGIDMNGKDFIIKQFGNIPLIRGRLDSNGNADAFANFSGAILDGAGAPTLLENTDLRGCFFNCNITNDAYGNDIPYWNTSNVTNMEYTFGLANNFNQPLNNWDTSKVNSMEGMFDFTNDFNQPLNNWNTSNVITMENMFQYAFNFNQPLNNWNTSNVTSMKRMFYIACDFNQSVDEWDTSNVNNMQSIFYLANNFNHPLNNWNTSNVNNMNLMFGYASNFNQPLDKWDTSNVIEMPAMFVETSHFNQPLNDWNTSNVTNMVGMFYSSEKFNQPLNNWDTSNVVNMSFIFYYANDFNQPLNDWDTSKVNTMRSMFEGAEKFNGDITGWKTSNVNNMTDMFCDASHFNQNILDWTVCDNLLGNATDMFKNATTWLINYERSDSNDSNFNGPVNDWIQKTTDLPNIIGTFIYRTDKTINSETDLPIINDQGGFVKLDYTCDSVIGSDTRRRVEVEYEWDSSKDNSTEYDGLNFFESCDVIVQFDNIPLIRGRDGHSNPKAFSKFTGVICDGAGAPTLLKNTSLGECFKQCLIDNEYFGNDIPIWNTCNVINMNNIFSGGTTGATTFYNKFNQNINKWNTSSVTNMIAMFSFTSNFNQPLNDWDTSNVNNMNSIFYTAKSFNQPLNDWNTSNVTSMKSTFKEANVFNHPLNDWDTSNVTTMEGMFNNAKIFNQPLNTWNTSNVSNMKEMFYRAENFNHPLNSWNTSNVSNMNTMFRNAKKFNQPLNDWNTSSVKDMENMLRFSEFFNHQLNDWDTSNVTTMKGMFYDAKRFNGDITGWNTSNVNDMEEMFRNANDFNKNITTWSVCDNLVGNAEDMFKNSLADPSAWLTNYRRYDKDDNNYNGPANDWYSLKKTGQFIFRTCDVVNNIQDLPIKNSNNSFILEFKCDGIVDNKNQFTVDYSYIDRSVDKDDGLYVKDKNITIVKFDNIPLQRISKQFLSFKGEILDGAGVPILLEKTSLDGCFNAIYCDINYGNDIPYWNTSNVTNMNGMFQDSRYFNQPLNQWDTSNVKTMRDLFFNAVKFNQPLNNWNTSSVNDMKEMFKTLTYPDEQTSIKSSFNQPLNDWDTSNVRNMRGIFIRANDFNQPLNGWDTSNVTSMISMFFGCKKFNYSISEWNVQKVEDMNYMFQMATAFNDNITNWDTQNTTSAIDMFGDATSWNNSFKRTDGIDITCDNYYDGPPNLWELKVE